MYEKLEFVRQQVDPLSRGLEIGPSHNPMLPKSLGYNVEIVDHLSREGLCAKYEGHQVDLQKIEHVDYIWCGGSLFDAIGKPEYYDWIVGSHVIEHVPDILGFLLSLEKLLKPTGKLILAIPDKRFCFDRFRQLSSIREVLDAHYSERSIHSAGTAVDYYLNVVSRNKVGAWGETSPGSFDFFHTLENAKLSIKQVNEKKQYLDVHAWIFTPTSFRLLIKDLNELGFINIKELNFPGRTHHEFLVVLGINGSSPQISRLQLLLEIENELDEVRVK